MYGAGGPWPDDVMDGCYVNYPDVDLADWEYLYYKDSLPRLQQRSRIAGTRATSSNHAQSIELPHARTVSAMVVEDTTIVL